MRFSLFTKIMLWFFLNLLLLAAIFLLLFGFRFAPQAFFFRPPNHRIEEATRTITDETIDKTRVERDDVLKRYGEIYNAEFYLFDGAGKQIGGREINLPPEILQQVTSPDQPLPPRGKLDDSAVDPSRRPPPHPSPMSFYFRTSDPPLYWYGMRTMMFDADRAEPYRARLIAASDSFYGHGLFFDPTSWLLTAAIIVGVSLLFWLPFVRGITKNIGAMTDATEQIAEEKFDVRVSEKRKDEIGRLGSAINHLASRLSGFVGGQKRFLGDISHELNSPLARMQFALSILEDRVDDANQAYVADVKEEVELMTKLVSELLAYSKAGIKTTAKNLEKIRLRPLIAQTVERETTNEKPNVKIEVPDALEAFAQPELLSRAIANLVRNAVRYAGDAGEIKISATNGNDETRIEIADNGAGVPEESLEKLFDPFYRIESDRARRTGGTGLGLAIVKTCVEACEGKVSARNRKPKGLAVTICLKS